MVSELSRFGSPPPPHRWTGTPLPSGVHSIPQGYTEGGLKASLPSSLTVPQATMV